MVIYHWDFRYVIQVCHGGYVMRVCHACITGVMHVPDMSLGMSCRCVMLVCHGDISWGFQVCHAGMSWVCGMLVCHACITCAMHVPEYVIRYVIQVCHVDMSWRYVIGISGM